MANYWHQYRCVWSLAGVSFPPPQNWRGLNSLRTYCFSTRRQYLFSSRDLASRPKPNRLFKFWLYSLRHYREGTLYCALSFRCLRLVVGQRFSNSIHGLTWSLQRLSSHQRQPWRKRSDILYVGGFCCNLSGFERRGSVVANRNPNQILFSCIVRRGCTGNHPPLAEV